MLLEQLRRSWYDSSPAYARAAITMVIRRREHHDGKEAEWRFPKGICLSPQRRPGILQHLPAKFSVDRLYGPSLIPPVQTRRLLPHTTVNMQITTSIVR
jgi:hypothetical protein